jgi:hypothetical protein
VVEDRFDIHPRRAGHQTDQDCPETQPVRDPAAVTPEGMGLDLGRQQRLDFPPDSIDHLGIERA